MVGMHDVLMGGQFRWADETDVMARFDRFASLGGRFIESAYSYGRGEAREMIGAWLRSNPGALGVVTKIGHGPTGEDIPLDAATVAGHTRELLVAYGVDQVEVLMLHCDDPERTVGELAASLRGVLDRGEAVRVGVSNWTAPRLASMAAEFADIPDRFVASYQLSLADADPDLLASNGLAATPTIRNILDAHNTALIAWSANARGFFRRDDDDVRPADPFDTASSRARRTAAREVAVAMSTRPETVALAWVLAQPRTCAVIGPRTIRELEQAAQATDLVLSADQCARLTEPD